MSCCYGVAVSYCVYVCCLSDLENSGFSLCEAINITVIWILKATSWRSHSQHSLGMRLGNNALWLQQCNLKH